MKIIKKAGILLAVIFIIAQFFGPDKNEGDIASLIPFITEIEMPLNRILGSMAMPI